MVNKTESEYIRDKKLQELDEQLYFSIDERSNIVDLSEKGREFLVSKLKIQSRRSLSDEQLLIFNNLLKDELLK